MYSTYADCSSQKHGKITARSVESRGPKESSISIRTPLIEWIMFVFEEAVWEDLPLPNSPGE
jgi:hypothetical protein